MSEMLNDCRMHEQHMLLGCQPHVEAPPRRRKEQPLHPIPFQNGKCTLPPQSNLLLIVAVGSGPDAKACTGTGGKKANEPGQQQVDVHV